MASPVDVAAKIATKARGAGLSRSSTVLGVVAAIMVSASLLYQFFHQLLGIALPHVVALALVFGVPPASTLLSMFALLLSFFGWLRRRRVKVEKEKAFIVEQILTARDAVETLSDFF